MNFLFCNIFLNLLLGENEQRDDGMDDKYNTVEERKRTDLNSKLSREVYHQVYFVFRYDLKAASINLLEKQKQNCSKFPRNET